MLYSTVRTLADNLASYLALSLGLKDDVVHIGSLDSVSTSTHSNKLFVTLVNIEREAAAGLRFNYRSVSDDRFKKTAPVWPLNLYVMLAAVFSAKQYSDGIKVLSVAIDYLQSHNSLSLPESAAELTIEPVYIPLSELSHLWGVHGGGYYPSVLCKIHTLHIDRDEIQGITAPVKQNE